MFDSRSAAASPSVSSGAPAPVRDLVAELEPLQRELNVAVWDASVSGSEADSLRRKELDGRIRALLSNPARRQAVQAARAALERGDAVADRELQVLDLLLAAHQMRPEVIARLVELEAGLDRSFNNFRAELDGRRVTDNELRRVLRESTNVDERRRAWEASKQIALEAEGPLLELVRLRNETAREQGYRDFYAMSLELDELDEGELFGLLDEAEAGTRERFRRYRDALDQRLAGRFGIAAADVRPWHLSDPFFQEAPQLGADLDAPFAGRDPVEIARRSFGAIGLELGDLVERADLYEKPGKSQHAFCLSVDRGPDVRVLCNLKPNEFWMSVLLHELGHALYDLKVDMGLPWLLRAPAHVLTTEATAILFERMTRNGAWLERFADMSAADARRTGRDLARATREQMLVMTRWCLVMCHMERAVYRDPEQDLDTLWWDLVERFQFVRRPEGRSRPDWASKIHFSVAPVYYHNYLLGHMLATQLEATLLARVAGRAGEPWDLVLGDPGSGRLLSERLFAPGRLRAWREAVHHATGKPFSAAAFVAEVCREE